MVVDMAEEMATVYIGIMKQGPKNAVVAGRPLGAAGGSLAGILAEIWVEGCPLR